MNQPRCPLCQSVEHQVMYDLSTFEYPHGLPGQIVRCRRCAMWYKIPVSSVRDAYDTGYAAEQYIENYMLSEPTRAFFRKVIAGIQSRPRLLDIGTGLGTFVEEAGQLGFDAQGVDLCAPLVEKARARGLKVQCKPAEDLDSTEKYDVVTMMDIIEHVPEPLALLASAKRVLKPGGELVVYTPNHRAAVVLLARIAYRFGLKFPVAEIFGGNHVCFFDNLTLPAALKQAGFELRELKLFPYDTSRPGGDISRLHLLATGAAERLGRPFGRMFRQLAFARLPA